ncbi:MAG: organic hydroperoxide resistance protein [Candidatus Limiplasma sp.]|nr:organic hydroperoxide resistance protein [Candidatus Limiplasma sp.]
MKIMYETKALSTGGRNGQVHVHNTPIRFEMASPSEMGGSKSSGFNPEQLFAAGYAACFGSAIQHVYKVRRLSLPDPDVQTTVGIGKNDAGGYALAVEIQATFRGVDQAQADSIVAEAHQVCPYSNATRGNVDVKVSAKVD